MKRITVWLHFPTFLPPNIGNLSSCITERRKSERKEREVAIMVGLVGDEANYDDSKKVWSLVYNTCKKV
jgi:hypothetical protein